MSRPNPHGLVDSHGLMSLFEDADIHKTSVIRVTGPGGLPALLWLCRHGYEQVGYLRTDRRGPNEPADAVLAAHTCGASGLAALLAHGPGVRDGGALVVQTPTDESTTCLRLLERAGYRQTQVLHGRRRDLHVVRRESHGLREAA